MKKLLLAALLLAASQTAIFAQTPAPSPTPPVVDDEEVVVINTNLVQLDVTVTDQNGKIVTDLTADDFEIFENDKKHQTAFASFVAPDKMVGSSKNAAQTNVSAPPIKLRREQVRRTMAFVVDDLGMSFASVAQNKQALKKIIAEQMQPNDLVAIIRTNSGIGALQQFTSDKRQLLAAVERIKWNPLNNNFAGKFGASSGATDLSQTNSDLTRSSANGSPLTNEAIESQEDARLREDLFAVGTLGAIGYVVRGMRDLPGRKSVMLLSEGAPLFNQAQPDQRVINALQSLTDLANRGAVVIYTMDTRGLQAGGQNMIGGIDGLMNSGFGRNILLNSRNSIFATQQALQYLAQKTGGMAIINTNQIERGVETMLADQSGYYLLGYEPDAATFDAATRRFNEITIKVKRPGLQARYRSGFFNVTDEQARPAPKTAQEKMIAALTSPFATGEINLSLTSLFANDAARGSIMRSFVHVNGSDLTFVPEKDGWHAATFDFAAVTFGDNGAVVDAVDKSETIRARAEALQEIRDKGFVYFVTVPIKKPGAYQMRVVLRDAATSRVGSANQFVEVPNLKKDRLALSGIVLQSAAVNQTVVTNQEQAQKDEDRDSAVRRFQLGKTIWFAFAIYNAKLDKTTNRTGLITQFKIFRDGAPIFTGEEKLLDTKSQSDLERITTGGKIRLNPNALRPGDYVLQVIVTDAAKRQTATQYVDFTIVG